MKILYKNVIRSGQLPISHGGYHHHQQTSDPLRAAARYYGGSSSTTSVPPPDSYMPPPRLVPYHPSRYPPINDYFVGHAVHSTTQLPSYTTHETAVNNYTCIGAPVGRGFVQGSGEGSDTSTVPNNNIIYFNCTTSNNNSNNNVEEEEGDEDEQGS